MSSARRMNKVIAYLLLSFLISGCTTCFERKIYKPKEYTSGEANVSIEQFNYTVGAVIELSKAATLRVSECTLKPEGAQTEPQEICLTVKLDEMHTFHAPNAELAVYSNIKTNLTLPMNDWEYRNEANPVSPTTSTIKPKAGKPGFYSFEATAIFNGASSKWAPPTIRAFSKDMRRREYTSSIKLPSNLGNQFYLKLPKVVVDGKEYALPILEFNLANETFCPTRA